MEAAIAAVICKADAVVVILSLRGRRSRNNVSICSHCNMHKDGSCGCLGVAGASASFDRGTLGLNEPIQFSLIQPTQWTQWPHTGCTENHNGYPEPHVNMTALEAVMEAGIGQETDTSGSRCTAERNHSCCQCVRPSFSIYVKYAEGCNPICICKTLSGS